MIKQFNKILYFLLVVSTITLIGLIIYLDLRVFEINGTSMYPNIKDGEKILCKKNYKKVEKNDVIVFNQSKLNYLVAHKVIKKFENKTFRTKGINNKFKDNYIVRQKNIKCKQFL